MNKLLTKSYHPLNKNSTGDGAVLSIILMEKILWVGVENADVKNYKISIWKHRQINYSLIGLEMINDLCQYSASSWYVIILQGCDSKLAPSQWETGLLCNDVSHWLGTSLESALMFQLLNCCMVIIIINQIAVISGYLLWRHLIRENIFTIFNNSLVLDQHLKGYFTFSNLSVIFFTIYLKLEENMSNLIISTDAAGVPAALGTRPSACA